MLRIAIDGPGGAGKSTIAKKVAAELHLEYIDTGAMYRAVGYKTKTMGIDPDNEEAMAKLMEETDIDFREEKIFLDGVDVSKEIRTQEMSLMASKVSALPVVRKKLVAMQRAIGENKNVIMDGRDIATNVLPGAEVKIFLTAAAEERANRRYKELIEKGKEADYETVLAEINERDHNDMTRKINPLRKAEDATELDTTGMSIEEVVAAIITEAKNGDCKTL